MPGSLTAHFENREYFFDVVKKVPADPKAGLPEELHIQMYTMPYVFVKNEHFWENRRGNKMNMVRGLIDAVIKAVDPASV